MRDITAYKSDCKTRGLTFRLGIQLLLFAFLVGCGSRAAEDPFVGEWKLNPSRSKLTDEMRVESLGANKYAFDFGTNKYALDLGGDGSAETIVVDGTDQPGISGTNLSVTAESPNAWKLVRKKDGRIFVTAAWTLSTDDDSLTGDFTSFGQDGSPSNVKYVYKRTAGSGPGFAGTWVSTSEAVNSVLAIQIRNYENGGLSITDPGGTTNLRFDGKSTRRLNGSALELVHKSKGKITQTQQFKLSPDLKTLEITTRTVGQTAPNILAFERQ